MAAPYWNKIKKLKKLKKEHVKIGNEYEKFEGALYQFIDKGFWYFI